LQTEGAYRFPLSIILSVTDYLGNHSIKFSKIWYVDASLQVKIRLKSRFSIWPFLAFLVFSVKNEENCRNPNRLMKFSEILYLDAFQQIRFFILVFFGLF